MRRVQGLVVVTHRWARDDFSICARRMHLRLEGQNVEIVAVGWAGLDRIEVLEWLRAHRLVARLILVWPHVLRSHQGGAASPFAWMCVSD